MTLPNKAMDRGRAANHVVLRMMTGALFALVAFGVLANLKDIKRYIHISMM